VVDGSALPIERPQQRGVLAYLLLNAGRVVSTQQMIDALWDGPPPPSARTVVQTSVWGIRRELRRAGIGDALTSQAGGYRVNPADGDLDLTVFADLVTRARVAAADGQAAAAAHLFREGLALWRGPALAGAAGAFVAAAVDQLHEQRLVAHEGLIDIELGLGRHGRLVAELRHLVFAHPLRERLVGQLMVALAGCGQQAQALRVYAEVRSRLAEELGVEPGPELAAAHLRVLRQQVASGQPAAPTPGWSAGPATVTAPATAAAPLFADRSAALAKPAQLPADITAFAGRAAHLRQLDTLLPADGASGRATAVISAIAGTAGVGKTTLAVHWAHRVADRFPDGQLYVNLRGFDPTSSPTNPAEVIRRFLDALGVPPDRFPADLDGQVGLYRSLLAGKRILVILDNARDAEQVRPLLPGAPGCLALVTSRNQLISLVTVEGARLLLLDLLSPTEARQLLTHRLGATRVAAEPAAVEQIIEACARLPLSLAIVAARAAVRPSLPLAALAEQLRAVRNGLDAFEGEDAISDLRAVLSWSYHALSPPAATLFRRLGMHPGPDLSSAAAGSLAGVPRRQTGALLAELTRAHMLTERIPDRYAFHDLLRAYAAELCAELDSETARCESTHRMLDHYLHTAHAAALLLDPLRDPITVAPRLPAVTGADLSDYRQAQDWFTAEHRALLAAQETAAGRFDVHAWQLAWAMTTFLDRNGHWADLAGAMRTALPAARRLDDPLAQAYTHRYLGRAYARLRRYDDARTHLWHAFGLFGQLGDLAGQANAHSNLGWVSELDGRRSEALYHTEQGLELFRAAGQTAGIARSLNEVGYRYAEMGRHQEALSHCQEALVLLEQLDDREGQAETWGSLGYRHRLLGEYEPAAASYQRAVDLYRELGDHYNAASDLTKLGDTHYTAGDTASAQGAWEQALSFLEELGHPDAEEVQQRLREAGLARLG
jgi:DNA-binding SARP family transcriptional activator/tetratricopeptide (TPR) repeat protein